jgi:hypothetical protein
MDQDKAISSPRTSIPDFCTSPCDSEMELWEPPFERWLRLADDLLREWPSTRRDATSEPSFPFSKSEAC